MSEIMKSQESKDMLGTKIQNVISELFRQRHTLYLSLSSYLKAIDGIRYLAIELGLTPTEFAQYASPWAEDSFLDRHY